MATQLEGGKMLRVPAEGYVSKQMRTANLFRTHGGLSLMTESIRLIPEGEAIVLEAEHIKLLSEAAIIEAEKTAQEAADIDRTVSA